MHKKSDKDLSRRSFLQGAGALGTLFLASGNADAQTQPHSEIRLRSYAIPNIPGQPVHHELQFIRSHSPVNLYANGYFFDRLTGMPGGEYGKQTLRVLMTNQDFGEIVKIGKPVSDVRLWHGGVTEFENKLKRIDEAMAFINSQRLDYLPVSLLDRGQNSNSVADTLMTAAALEYPEDAGALWAPGRGRILLPEKFVSFYDQPAEMVQTAAHHNLSGVYAVYVRSLNMQGTEIGAAIVKEGTDRRGQGITFFNPERPEYPVMLGANFGAALARKSVLAPAAP